MLQQEQVVDVLNKYFVCIEYDATTNGAMPAEKYPGLAHIREFWDVNPWTRVTFGCQFMISSDGQYMLSAGPQRHFRQGEAKVFQGSLEEALARHRRVNQFEPGTPERAAEIAKVKQEVDADWNERHWYFTNPDRWTNDIFTSKARIEERFPKVLEQPEKFVRRRVCELLGRYAERTKTDGFLPDGEWHFFGDAVAARLDDPEPEVRHAAAVTLHQFVYKKAPLIESDDELVAAARELWDVTVKARGGPAEAEAGSSGQ